MICDYLVNKIDFNGYESIVTLLDFEIKISNYLKSIKIFPRKKDKLLVDTALCSGVNEYRFISVPLKKDGTVELSKFEYVKVDEETLKIANKVLANNPKYLNNSVLPRCVIDDILK